MPRPPRPQVICYDVRLKPRVCTRKVPRPPIGVVHQPLSVQIPPPQLQKNDSESILEISADVFFEGEEDKTMLQLSNQMDRVKKLVEEINERGRREK